MKKTEFDNLINRYFCDEEFPEEGKIPLVGGKRVIPYAIERLRKLNQEQACQSMNYDGVSYTETSSKTPDTVLRIDEGPVAPLINETKPEEAVGKVHNYVIVLVRNPLTGLWESKIEFLRMNLVEVRSKHAHIILSKIDPERTGEFLYIASGECIFDGRSTIVNIQSGMNWEINLSRPGISMQVEEIRSRMTGGKIENLFSRGVGPKNDFWGAIAFVFFREVLQYPNVEYGTSTLRKKTTETKETIQKFWCEAGVDVEEYNSVKNCRSREGGRSLCSPPTGLTTSASTTRDLNTLKVAELREMLETMGMEIVGRPRKAELIALIEELIS